jgi:aryl-alcohol dehydrogenase-like predicted oxidoreductase
MRWSHNQSVVRAAMMRAPMQYRPFGITGIVVGEIGLGCSPLGGGLFRHDRREARNVVAAALNQGVNFFDTADNYSMGESERLLGSVFGGRRDKVVIATKVGATYGLADRLLLRARPLLRPIKGFLQGARRSINLVRDKRKHYDFTDTHMTRAVEGSLRRLGTDRIDLYQLYNPSPQDLRNDSIFNTLRKLKQAGKIIHYGVTANSVHDAMPALDCPDIASIQLPVSLLDQNSLSDFLGRASARGIAVIASTPLGQGLLTDTLGVTKADESSHFTFDEVSARRRRAQLARRWIKTDRSLPQMALRFVLQTPGVSVAIPSAVNLSELIEDLATLQCPSLTERELTEMRALA